MYPDLKELLSAFNAQSVKYLIVGGYAVGLHAQPRATKDLDLFVRADTTNARAVYAALASFGAPLENMSVDDFADPRYFLRFGREPVAVDLLPSIDGVDFDSAWEHRVEGVVDAESGLTAFFISRDDLVASKLAAGRLGDLADVEAIREAEESRRPRVQDNANEQSENGPGQ